MIKDDVVIGVVDVTEPGAWYELGPHEVEDTGKVREVSCSIC